MAEDKMVEAIDVPLAVARAKRMRYKPHTTECSCDECEQFLTGWDMGFAHAYTYAAAQVGPYKTALSDMVATLEGAVETIHIFHGDAAWEIYRDNAPEMKQINNALATAKDLLAEGEYKADDAKTHCKF